MATAMMLNNSFNKTCVQSWSRNGLWVFSVLLFSLNVLCFFVGLHVCPEMFRSTVSTFPPPFSSYFKFEYSLSFRFPGGPGVPEGSRKSVGFKREKICSFWNTRKSWRLRRHFCSLRLPSSKELNFYIPLLQNYL